MVTRNVISEREDGSRRVRFMCDSGKSKVEQSHAGETNINAIMAKYKFTGLVNQKPGGMYGDFTDAVDYHTARNRLLDADKDFMMLPAKLRKRFDNDPGKLLDFLLDPENREEAMDLGLIDRPDPVTPEPESEPESEPAE